MGFWWKKRLPLLGSVFFRGDLPLQPGDFEFLKGIGCGFEPAAESSATDWTVELRHPQWGAAKLSFRADAPMPPREVFQFSPIPEADRDAACTCRSVVDVSMDSATGHVLRDRKLLLRYLRAVMADDGVIALDHLAGKAWTREDLDDELSHDADLDIEGIIGLHCVTDNGKVFWVHSHGLAEVGGFDFDILEPSEDAFSGMVDLMRAIASHILDGTLERGTKRFPLVHPGGFISLVDVDTFLAKTDESRRRRLEPDYDQHHRQNRCVLCEPEGGFLGGLLGSRNVQPVRFLTGKIPANPVINFSTTASDLMGERARATYPLFQSLKKEFADFDFVWLVKMGITTDDGHGREHLWFQVHGCFDDAVDGELANEPYNVSGMKEGDRGRQQVELISDWMVLTPVGAITPRAYSAVRAIRARPDVIRRMMER